MIWIFVDRDLVAIPEPVVTEAIVEWGDPKIEAAEPEAFPVSASKPEDMATAKAAVEAPMFPGMIEVIVGIIAAGIVSDPATVGVDVRGVRMPGVIAKSALTAVVRTEPATAILWRRGRPMAGNEATAYMTAAMGPTPLGKGGDRKDQQHSKKSGNLFHAPP